MCICNQCEHNIVWLKEAKEQKECEFKEPFFQLDSADYLCSEYSDYEEKYSSPAYYTC